MRPTFLILLLLAAALLFTSCGVASYQLNRAANLLRVPVRTGQVLPTPQFLPAPLHQSPAKILFVA